MEEHHDAEDDEAAARPRRVSCRARCASRHAKAQRTFAKAHDSAAEQYGEGERAHRVAYDALKHSFEKVGDHWEPKSQKGPSDSRARSGGPNPKGRSAEGVDANASKKHLVEVARRLDISGRSTMSKGELVSAIKKANRRVDGAQPLGLSRRRRGVEALQQHPFVAPAASACAPCGG